MIPSSFLVRSLESNPLTLLSPDVQDVVVKLWHTSSMTTRNGKSPDGPIKRRLSPLAVRVVVLGLSPLDASFNLDHMQDLR